MTKSQLSQAIALVENNHDFFMVDDTILHGCALSGFKPVYCTIEQAAKIIGHCAMQLNCHWDSHALNDISSIARTKFLIV